MSALADYIRHAERHGVDGVHEVARRDLAADDLAMLERRLRELEPKWRPPRAGTAQDGTRAAGPVVRHPSESKTRACPFCGSSLAGYRRHARVCRRASCRKRAQRQVR
jgi:hypothetical protein